MSWTRSCRFQVPGPPDPTRSAGRALPAPPARWQHCAADALRRSPAAFRWIPGSAAPGRSRGPRVPAAPHLPRTACASRVTAGPSPHHGARSGSGVCVAPGITVALANWPSSLDFKKNTLYKIEVQEKLINAPSSALLPHFFCAASFILGGPLVSPLLAVPGRRLAPSLQPGAPRALRCRLSPLEGTVVTRCAGARRGWSDLGTRGGRGGGPRS